MKSPHPISVCAQTFTPRSECVANGAHADKGGGFVGKRGGVGARTAEQRRRKGGARANTGWRRTPPPSSGVRGMGSSSLCTSQTGGGNGRGRVQSGGAAATRGGVSAEGTKGGEVSTYLSAPLMQTVGRVPACLFEWGLEAEGGVVVRVKARKRGRRVNRVEAAHSIRVSCCRVNRAEGEGKGQGVTFRAPCANKGATPLLFVRLSCSHVRGAEEG